MRARKHTILATLCLTCLFVSTSRAMQQAHYPHGASLALSQPVLSDDVSNLAHRLGFSVQDLRKIFSEYEKAPVDVSQPNVLRHAVPGGIDCEHIEWQGHQPSGHIRSDSMHQVVSTLSDRKDQIRCFSCHTRCDKSNVCSTVCKRGTVKQDPWAMQALAYQWRLARRHPFCLLQVPASHNSAITIADGYGNRDALYERYLQYLKPLVGWPPTVETNNQWLSVTDQLNMGTRFIELDVHWVAGDLRIAHCGGFHSPELNQLVQYFNKLARLFGHPVEWDAETVGCSPSMSSIAVHDQRTFSDALQEVKTWLDAHPGEFLILYLDNQKDIKAWGRLPYLLSTIQQYFPVQEIMTPPEVQAMGGWPTIDEMVARGKRVVLLSRTDYREDMASLMFKRSLFCNITEPVLQNIDLEQCSWHAHWSSATGPLMASRLIRSMSCALRYGPLNCLFQKGDDEPTLDSVSIPPFTACGLNLPSPDRIIPSYNAAQIWSWAEGQPQPITQPLPANQSECVVIDADEGGRWYVQACGGDVPTACRKTGIDNPRTPNFWALDTPGTGCPKGYVQDVPHTGFENRRLVELMEAARIARVKLPVSAPDYLPGWFSESATTKEHQQLVGMSASSSVIQRPANGVVAEQ